MRTRGKAGEPPSYSSRYGLTRLSHSDFERELQIVFRTLHSKTPSLVLCAKVPYSQFSKEIR